MLRRVRDLAAARGGPVPLGDLYTESRESAQVYAVLRGLEDRSRAIAFVYREDPRDQWSNWLPFVTVTSQGHALLAEAGAA